MNAGRAVIVSDEMGCGPDLVRPGENGEGLQGRGRGRSAPRPRHVGSGRCKRRAPWEVKSPRSSIAGDSARTSPAYRRGRRDQVNMKFSIVIPDLQRGKRHRGDARCVSCRSTYLDKEMVVVDDSSRFPPKIVDTISPGRTAGAANPARRALWRATPVSWNPPAISW